MRQEAAALGSNEREEEQRPRERARLRSKERGKTQIPRNREGTITAGGEMSKETLKTTQQREQNGSEIVTCSSGAGRGSQECSCHLPRGRSTHPSVTNLRSRHLLSPPLAGLATSQRGQSWANSATCWRRGRTARVPILPTTQDVPTKLPTYPLLLLLLHLHTFQVCS